MCCLGIQITQQVSGTSALNLKEKLTCSGHVESMNECAHPANQVSSTPLELRLGRQMHSPLQSYITTSICSSNSKHFFLGPLERFLDLCPMS